MNEDEILLLKFLIDNEIGTDTKNQILDFDILDLVAVSQRVNKPVKEIDAIFRNLKTLNYLEHYQSFIDLPHDEKDKRFDDCSIKVSKTGIDYHENINKDV